MGCFYVDCEIENVKTGRKAQVTKLLVDSGSEFSWIPESSLRTVRIKTAKKDITLKKRLVASGPHLAAPAD